MCLYICTCFCVCELVFVCLFVCVGGGGDHPPPPPPFDQCKTATKYQIRAGPEIAEPLIQDHVLG